MEFVGLGKLPRALADRVSWSQRDLDLFFELLGTKRHDLRYISRAMGRSYMEVQAMVQKLDLAARNSDPIDQRDIPFAHEVPDNFDSVFVPAAADAPAASDADPTAAAPNPELKIRADAIKLFEERGLRMIKSWTQLCGVAWSKEMVNTIAGLVVAYLEQTIRSVATCPFLPSINGEKWVSEYELVRLNLLKPPSPPRKKTAYVEDPELVETILKSKLAEYDPNWLRLHIQDYMLDLGRCAPLSSFTLESCSFVSRSEKRAAKRLKVEADLTEEHDRAETVDFIRGMAAAKGDQPSILDMIAGDFEAIEDV